MLITVLIHDFSKNGFVRAYPILKVLQKNHDLQLLGFSFQEEVFPIYLNEFDCKIVYTKKHLFYYFRDFWKVFLSIEGEVIYAFKPRVPSFLTALIHKLLYRTPIILDNEDWEGEHFFTQSSLKAKFLMWKNKNIFSVENPIYRGLLEYLTPLADEITVVSTFLQNRSGGTLLLHGADEEQFNPSLFDSNRLKEEYNLKGFKVLVFTGTVFPHKGLEELLKAINSIKGHLNIKLVIAGAKNKHVDHLLNQWQEEILYLGPLPHKDMPKILSLADATVLAQKDTFHAQAQVPAKIFEAMAMKVPIITSRVSDIPLILREECYYIEDYSTKAIAKQLENCLLNVEQSQKKAKAARQRFLSNYTYGHMNEILSEILSNIKSASR